VNIYKKQISLYTITILITFMTCILLRQVQDVRCLNDIGMDYKFIYAILCDAKVRSDCLKQRNPLIITPHCWRMKE